MEIERKWLADPLKIPYDLTSLEHYEIQQAYIGFSPTVRIRKITDPDRYVLTIKNKISDSDNLARSEIEIDINRHQFDELMKEHVGNVIEKTRYIRKRQDGLTEEIDIFKGMFEGLAYLEIEFDSIEQARAFPQPDWVIKDVTNIGGFSNGALASDGMPQIDLTRKE